MNGTELIIKIDILYFLGIIGTLIIIVWYAASKFGKLEDSIDWIKREFGNLWDAIKNREAQRSGLEAAGSPINPTELGWKYIKESGLDNIIDQEKKEYLLEQLQNSLDTENNTEYDVQEKARKLLVLMRDNQMFKPIKEYAFNNGIDVDIILRLGGLLLRDNFLKKSHKIAPPKKQ